MTGMKPPPCLMLHAAVLQPRRSILSATERDSLMALPEGADSLIRHYSLGSTRKTGRVERWRGGLGRAYLLPALSFAGASLAQPCSVSTSRSSNRTCGFPASGSRTRTHAFAHEKVAVAQPAVGRGPTSRAGTRRGTRVHSPSRHLVLLAQPPTEPMSQRVRSTHPIRPADRPEAEVVRPARPASG